MNKTSAPCVADVLATFVTSQHGKLIPLQALDRAKMIIASTVASSAAGYSIKSANIVRDLEIESGGKLEATAWFSGQQLPAHGAARCNAVASDAAASDDSDMRSVAHIGTVVSTAALAMGEKLGCGGPEVLRAVVLGYEVAGRMDESLAPGRMRRGFHGSVATVFSAAVSAGVLLDLDRTQMVQAIAIAATSIGGLALAADTSWAREYHAGHSVWSGINAARAAQLGYQAEPAILEGERGFFSAMGGQLSSGLLLDLGASWDIVTDMAIKLMPGAHNYHAIAEAAAAAAIEGNVDPARVDRIIVSATNFTGSHGPTHPRDLVSAAHSLAYFAAAAVADRGFRWDHMRIEKMADPMILRLLDKIELDDAVQPKEHKSVLCRGGAVTIVMDDGTKFSQIRGAPRGAEAGGVRWSDIDEKYRALLPLSGLGQLAIEKSLDVIHSLESVGNVSHLVQHLCVESEPRRT